MTGTAAAREPGPGEPGAGVVGVPGRAPAADPRGPGPRGPRPRGAARRPDLLPLLTALASLLAVGGALWLGALRTVVHACVTIDGPLALVGVRLSLLQDAADCPTGVALTPGAAQGAVLVLGLVVPVVAVHAALGALGLGLAALLLGAARTVRSVLGAVVRALPRSSTPRPAPGARPAPACRADHPRASVLARALHPHRGPPALA